RLQHHFRTACIKPVIIIRQISGHIRDEPFRSATPIRRGNKSLPQSFELLFIKYVFRRVEAEDMGRLYTDAVQLFGKFVERRDPDASADDEYLSAFFHRVAVAARGKNIDTVGAPKFLQLRADVPGCSVAV